MSRRNDSFFGVLSNYITKVGYQNWLSVTAEEEPSNEPSELALTPIEKVKSDEIGNWVMEVIEYAIKFRDDHYLNSNWEAFRNLYNGEFWNDDMLDDYSSRVVTNWLKELVRSRAAYTTANQMGISAYSVEQGDVGKEEYISDSISWVLYNNNFQGMAYDCRVEAETVGTSYLRVDWDSELTPPMGDVRLRLLQPDRVVADWETEDLQHGRFAAEIHYKTIDEIKMIWPNKASKFGGLTHKGETFDSKQKNKLMLIEIFCVDKRMVTQTIQEEQVINGEVVMIDVETKVPKYPNGRRIIVCEGVVLSDEVTGVLFRQNGVVFPFAVSKGSRQPHEQYGVSTIGEYESIVKDIIKREGAISDILERFAYPVPLVAKGHFKDPSTQAIFGRDILWEYSPRNGVAPPSLLTPPSGILNNSLSGLNNLKGDFQTLSGMVDVSVGQAAGSLQSGRGILALQQRVDLRNSPMIKEHGETLKMLAKIILAYIQVGYTEQRLLRRMGERGALEFTRINQENGSGARLNDPTVGTFDIAFDVNSGAPTNYVARSEESVQMAQAGLLDPLTAIERSDLPNKTAVIRRLVSMGSIHPMVAVNDGYLAEDDPIVQMIMGVQQQQQEAEAQGNTASQLTQQDVLDAQ